MSLRVEQVSGRRGLARFIDVPFRLFGRTADPAWVPPLRLAVRDMLDRDRNPFYGEADHALLVARRGADVVGRVAAIENRWHNRHHGDRVGFFGFFECVDDPEAAGALLGAAERWLADRGLEVCRGPVSPSMNHECGLLVEGFRHPPVVLTPWNPPYYSGLLERAGFAKVKDLLAYRIPVSDGFRLPERVETLADRVRARTRLHFRDADFGDLEAEARRLWPLFCEAWSDNWGFVPPAWEEFLHLAKGLKPMLRPDFSFVAEADGRAVGFLLIVADLNRIFADMPSGRLWPWNVVRLLVRTPRLTGGRIMLLGIRKEDRRRGLLQVFLQEAARRGARLRAEYAEASWVLEDNEALRNPIEAMGLAPHRRWRIYERTLSAPAAEATGKE